MQVGSISGSVAAIAGQSLPSSKLVRAAHEFEGQMMKELLQPMLAGDSLTGADAGSLEADLSGPTGALGEFASEALGNALSERGGFGIADRIVHELSRTNNHPGNGKVTRSLNVDTAIRAPK